MKDVKALNRESILEFLRVEALLRSPKVHEICEMGENRVELFPGIEVSRASEEILFKKYGITWEVLWGSHHSDLDQREDPLKPYNSGAYEAPVCDIKADVLNSSEKEKRAESWKKEILRSHKPDLADGSLIFQLNAWHSPQIILDTLKPLLQKAHYI